MKKTLTVFIFSSLLMSGCDSLRFAPDQAQKQNAWLHNRTTEIAAETARIEKVSGKLQDLTRLSNLQSRAFTAYFGLPKEFPAAETAENLLAESNFESAEAALEQSVKRPDPWQMADSLMEIAIGISALLGGVYGTKAVRFLKTAKQKSNALKEIIQGNEFFKQKNQDYCQAFKAAQKDQSANTRQIVAELKK